MKTKTGEVVVGSSPRPSASVDKLPYMSGLANMWVKAGAAMRWVKSMELKSQLREYQGVYGTLEELAFGG